MGLANSKTERNEALRLCKERMMFIKQAINSRYALAAAHVSYIQSLKNIGIALRRYVEAEVLIDSSLSTTSATELDKSPSDSTFPSPSPSQINEVSDSPLHNEESPSPKLDHVSPPVANFNFMRTSKSAAVTVTMYTNSGINGFVEDESLEMPMPPPPPPFRSGSWDFFDPSDDSESFRFVGNHNELNLDVEYMRERRQFGPEGAGHNMMEGKGKWAKVALGGTSDYDEGPIRPELGQKASDKVSSTVTRNNTYGHACPISSEGFEMRQADVKQNANGLVGTSTGYVALEQSGSKREKTWVEKDLCAEREDPSEFITHRAKDFLASIKDIEHRFFKASELGREVSRLLEANKIRVGFSVAKGGSSVSDVLAACPLACSRGKTALVSNDPIHHVTKVITWKRTTSSRSSSSRNPLAAKDGASDSGSDFVEEFCMIAGSHSSTLERLYAWERKLYDEVKASESIRKEYDRKCGRLRRQFAKDHSASVIDKTRAVVKDLHSQIRVALHSVDTISRQIEKMRDEELHPQLVELIQGLIRMWKAMLECHHAQYITISLAYHSRRSTGTPQRDTCRQIMAQLQEEIECFGLSFADWVNSLTSYVQGLNGWLHNCIIQPQERSKSRKPFSPRRAGAPPIFVLCRDWSAGIRALPSEELSNEIKTFLSNLSDLHPIMEQQAEQQQEKLKLVEPSTGELEGKNYEKIDDDSSNLRCLHSSLAKVLDRLNKFSEASLKMYEDIRQKSEAYMNAKPARI